MSETISVLIAAIPLALRYVASGFFGLGLLMLVIPGLADQPDDLLRAQPFFGLVGGLVVGVMLNGIHVAVFEDAFALVVIAAIEIRKTRGTSRVRRALAAFEKLDRERMLRRVSPDSRVTGIQRQNDSLAATLTSLYCTGYSSFLVALYACHVGVAGIAWCWVLGFVLLASAVVLDFRYTCLDFWASEAFPQGDRGQAGKAEGAA